MKKIISTVLAGAVMLGLSACSGSSKGDETVVETTMATTTTEATTTTTTEETTTESSEEDYYDESEETLSFDELIPSDGEIFIDFNDKYSVEITENVLKAVRLRTNTPVESYVNRMRSKDVLTVCAGGNGDERTGLAYKDKPVYPGDFEGCLCVTSLDIDGTNSAFSDYSMAKDISAPGTGIISTITDERDNSPAAVPDEGYAYLSGTSMASPLVSGVAALIWADNPQLTADQVYESIIETAKTVNPASHDHTGETGSAGAVDAAAAMQYARDNFDNTRESLSDGTITVNESGLEYDGTEKEPAVTITCGGKRLIEGRDYILSYRNCILPGKAQVTATGITNYIGMISAEYVIAKADIAKASVTLQPEQFGYDGNYHFPDISVTMDGNTLEWGKDFSPTGLTNGIDKGLHKIELTGKGNYTGKKTVSYRIGAATGNSGNAAGADSKKGSVNKTNKKKASTSKTAVAPKVDSTFTAGKFTYKITSVKKPLQVKMIKSTAGGKVSVPNTGMML